MRAYSRVAPQFWTGATGRALRKAGRDAQTVALYLITGPSASMTGIFYLPLPTLRHEVGITRARALTAIGVLEREGFARYDTETETVWIPEMARFQLGETLAPGDKRITGLIRELEVTAPAGHRFVDAFFGKYREAFNLPDRAAWKGLRRSFEGASGGSPPPQKPLRSQEQEQEQEQEREQEQEQEQGEKGERATARAPDDAGPVEGVSPEELVSAWNANCGGMAEARSLKPRRRKLLRAFLQQHRGLLAEEFGAVARALGTDPWACGTKPGGPATPVDIEFLLEKGRFDRWQEKLGSPLRPPAPPGHAASNTPGRYADIDRQAEIAGRELAERATGENAQ